MSQDQRGGRCGSPHVVCGASVGCGQAQGLRGGALLLPLGLASTASEADPLPEAVWRVMVVSQSRGAPQVAPGQEGMRSTLPLPP